MGIERDILHLLSLLSRLMPRSVANAHGNLTVCRGEFRSADRHALMKLANGESVLLRYEE